MRTELYRYAHADSCSRYVPGECVPSSLQEGPKAVCIILKNALAVGNLYVV
jgi:hypothetical protein